MPGSRNRPVDVRDIAAEAVTLAGGGRALLLQIAHPAVGRGVVEHSDFASRLMDRFDGTMLYLTASMFGSPDEVAGLRRSVNRAHAPVRGGGDGTPNYNAFDPELQLWVAATLYQTMMEVHRRIFGGLTPEQADAAYQGMVRALSNLQLSTDRWPPSRTEFDRYWEGMIPALAVDGDVLEVSRHILYPRAVPWWLRPALPFVRLVTAGLLPPEVRDEFGLEWDALRQRRFERALRWTGTVYPRLPLRIRHLPRDRYLATLHSMMESPEGAARGARGSGARESGGRSTR